MPPFAKLRLVLVGVLYLHSPNVTCIGLLFGRLRRLVSPCTAVYVSCNYRALRPAPHAFSNSPPSYKFQRSAVRLWAIRPYAQKPCFIISLAAAAAGCAVAEQNTRSCCLLPGAAPRCCNTRSPLVVHINMRAMPLCVALRRELLPSRHRRCPRTDTVV